jgi:hypothetical protein
MRWNVPRDHGPSPDHRTLSNRYSIENHRIRANPGGIADPYAARSAWLMANGDIRSIEGVTVSD